MRNPGSLAPHIYHLTHLSLLSWSQRPGRSWSLGLCCSPRGIVGFRKAEMLKAESGVFDCPRKHPYMLEVPGYYYTQHTQRIRYLNTHIILFTSLTVTLRTSPSSGSLENHLQSPILVDRPAVFWYCLLFIYLFLNKIIYLFNLFLAVSGLSCITRDLCRGMRDLLLQCMGSLLQRAGFSLVEACELGSCSTQA